MISEDNKSHSNCGSTVIQLLPLMSAVFLSENLHDNGTFLTPDALGGVLGLHVGIHPFLQNTRDVSLDHIGAVVSVGKRESRFISGIDKSALLCFL